MLLNPGVKLALDRLTFAREDSSSSSMVPVPARPAFQRALRAGRRFRHLRDPPAAYRKGLPTSAAASTSACIGRYSSAGASWVLATPP